MIVYNVNCVFVEAIFLEKTTDSKVEMKVAVKILFCSLTVKVTSEFGSYTIYKIPCKVSIAV